MLLKPIKNKLFCSYFISWHFNNNILFQDIIEDHHDEQSDVIKEMLAEAAQGVILEEPQTNYSSQPNDNNGDLVYDNNFQGIIESEVVEHDQVIYEEQIIEQEEDMYEQQLPLTAGLDEKSSSFPFGNNVEQSETSEDALHEQVSEETHNNSDAVDNSLLASMAGDNANSLPSVGGGEDSKRDEDYETIQPNCEKMDSDDSLSEPAIAEDPENHMTEGSNATIVNTEMVSEDELPLPSKPEINDAEEVSDEELPAPQRAELPPDAEVISEDELPVAASGEKQSAANTPEHAENNPENNAIKAQKRKADDGPTDKSNTIESISEEIVKEKVSKKDEQYNPMSPTGESNDAPEQPAEKKPKIEGNIYYMYILKLDSKKSFRFIENIDSFLLIRLLVHFLSLLFD